MNGAKSSSGKLKHEDSSLADRLGLKSRMRLGEEENEVILATPFPKLDELWLCPAHFQTSQP